MAEVAFEGRLQESCVLWCGGSWVPHKAHGFQTTSRTEDSPGGDLRTPREDELRRRQPRMAPRKRADRAGLRRP